MALFSLGAGAYPYTPDLQALNRARRREVSSLHPALSPICSPLSDRSTLWRQTLSQHPDSEFQRYVLDGIERGFRIGFDHASPLVASRRNMPSVNNQQAAIDEYIGAEVRAGRILGPFSREAIEGLHTNRMGLVPKGHIPGRWRIITDLSFPKGSSVNDGICADLCSLKYTSVSIVAGAAMQLGRGALLAKLDIKSAYRLVPVHPEDRHLLGVEWKTQCYVDGMLPFGLRSAPKIFTAVADALEWILRQRGVSYLDHYLDDFVTFGPPASEVCGDNLRKIVATCQELGVPLAMEKLEGPTHCLTFLGIEIDTQAGVLRLPTDKLSRLKQETRRWAIRRSCRRRQLESLIGTLHHACQVIRPGRTFMRRMIDLLRIPCASRAHHHIRLNAGFRADLLWWHTFAGSWNGVAIVPDPTLETVTVTSDASGSWGCGAWSDKSWFQWQWPPEAQELHISFKELFAGLLACVAWGARWKGRKVRWQCDNQAAVHAARSRTCRDQAMMHLIRGLVFFEARFSFELVATYLPGRENSLADDLSRDRLSVFLSKVQGHDPAPAFLHPAAPALLLDRAGWTSPLWTTQFASIATAE